MLVRIRNSVCDKLDTVHRCIAPRGHNRL